MNKASTVTVPIYQLTRGPGHHWFGYYDKQQFDIGQRYVLGMEVGFENRRPSGDDVIKVGMVDLESANEWIDLGQSRAWCWQMGCMLQWLPGHRNEIIWNDRSEDGFVCHILDVASGKKRTLPFAFFAVHPDGKTALGLDFERLEHLRPGYGYAGIADKNKDILAPEDAGIYKLDLETGEKKLIISLAEIARIPDATRDMSNGMHYFNCLLFGPGGERFAFLHRWRLDRGTGWPFKTRMFTANADGTEPYILVPGGCGHFNWRDSRHLVVQADGFGIYQDQRGRVGEIGRGVMPSSGGHVSYLPGGEWVVGDTYADDERKQHLYLFHVASGEIIMLGSFESPMEYADKSANNYEGEWRCDLHPRVSRDGRYLVIDSTHDGSGRQMYMLDISEVVAGR
ncbi:MAG: hypothetical protein JW936_05910 [Sedimentisphaerales bacterium]|nr:hypothetical protein [Sedimentisphaerales bacterium]